MSFPPEVRNWSWFFESLWNLCSKTGDKKLKLCIIDTLLFDHGVPTKWVGTSDEGFLVRKDLTENCSVTGSHFQGDKQSMMSQCLHNFKQICSRKLYRPGISDYNLSTPFIRAWYTDGEMEDMTEPMFDTLWPQGKWRSQLAGLQTRMPSTGVASIAEYTGRFTVKEKISSLLDTEAVPLPGINELTRSVAKVIEQAYSLLDAHEMHQSAQEKINTTGVTTQLLQPPSTVQVIDLCLVFLQHGETLWLQYAKHLETSTVMAAAEYKAYVTFEKNTRIIAAARQAGSDLKNLLKKALLTHRVTPKLAFDHFDTTGSGLVTSAEMVVGMSKLGLCVTKNVSEELIKSMISRTNSSFFDETDLKLFALDFSDLEQLARNDSEVTLEVPVEVEIKEETALFPPETSVSQIKKTRLNHSQRVDRVLRKCTPKQTICSPVRFDVDKDVPSSPEAGSKASIDEKRSSSPKPKSQSKQRPKSRSLEDTVKQDTKEVKPARAPLKEGDEEISIGPGVFMRYRCLSYLKKKLENKENDESVLEEGEAALHQIEFLNELSQSTPIDTQVTMVIMADLFMSLDTLEDFVLPLLYHFNDILRKQYNLRIVLVDLPEIASSIYSNSKRNCVETHEACIRELLKTLLTASGRTDCSMSPLIMVAVGMSGPSLAMFVSKEFRNDLVIREKGHGAEFVIAHVVFISSIVKINSDLHFILSEIREILEEKDADEYREQFGHMFLQLHISDTYLNKFDVSGRENAMAKFWKTRRSLLETGPTLKKRVCPWIRSFLSIQSFSDTIALSSKLGSSSGRAFEIIPVTVIHGTKDRFAHPRNIDDFVGDCDLRVKVSDIKDLSMPVHISKMVNENMPVQRLSKLLNGHICVQYVEGGHELLQEKTSFLRVQLAKLIFGSLQSCKLETVEDSDNMDATEQIPATSLEAETQPPELENKQIVAAESPFPIQVNRRTRRTAIMSESSEDKPPGMIISAVTDEIVNNDVLDGLMNMEGRQEEEKLRRGRAQGRQKMLDMQQRDDLLKKIYEARSLVLEQENIERELYEMFKEDRLSGIVRREASLLLLIAASNDAGQEQIKQIDDARNQDQKRKVEEELVTRRSMKHLEKIRIQEEDRLRILHESTDLEGDSIGYAIDENLDVVDEAVRCVERLYGDILTSRQRLIDSAKRSAVIYRKISVFEKRMHDIEKEIMKIRRAVRFVESQRSKSSESQISEMEERIQKRLESLADIKTIIQSQRALLHASDGVSQCLSQKLSALEKAFSQAMLSLHRLVLNMSTKHSDNKSQKENSAIAVSKEQSLLQLKLDRSASLRREIDRTRDFSAEWTDTDIWQAGVCQRMKTLDLKTHLNEESSACKGDIRRHRSEIERLSSSIASNVVRMETLKKEIQLGGQCERVLQAEWDKYLKRLLKVEIEKAVSEEESIEEDKVSGGRENQSAGSHRSMADMIRHKRHESRIVEEKRWMALDMVVNNSMYDHLSDVEAEEIMYDADYKTELIADDIRRLMRLPHQIQLAMCFLRSKMEFDAYRLITKFSFEKDDELLKKEDCNVYSSGAKSDSTAQSKEQLREAEETYDVTIKQFRATRIRSMLKKDLLDEEREWLAMDKILNPHLFTKDSPLEAEKPSQFHSKKKDRQGDVFEDARKDYIDDAGIFSDDHKFSCRLDKTQLLTLFRAFDSASMDSYSQHKKSLMDKYFVDENDSKMGQQRTGAMKILKKTIDSIFSKDDTKLGTTSKNSFLDRVWGSWTEVHPASSGNNSQNQLFSCVTYDCSVNHPASFALLAQDATTQDVLSKPDGVLIANNMTTLSLLKRETVKKGCTYVLCHEFSGSAPQKEDASEVKVLQASSQKIHARQSKSHKFRVSSLSDESKYLPIELVCTIVYSAMASFEPEGKFKPGRISAALYRLCDDGNSFPMMVGCSPKQFQMLNEKQASPGRIVIQHRFVPHLEVDHLSQSIVSIDESHLAKINKSMEFNLVIGSCNSVTYSIEVNCVVALQSNDVLQKSLESCKLLQSRLPLCVAELEDLMESIRLSERKFQVVRKMIDQAEAETTRCEREYETIKKLIEEDDVKMYMSGEERSEAKKDLQVMELELSHWCKLYCLRIQEREDVRDGIELMYKLRRDRETERTATEKHLSYHRKIIPSCTAVLIDFVSALKVASEINSSVIAANDDTAKFVALSAVAEAMKKTVTPAEQVRNRHEQQGFESLTLEEQKWVTLDKVLCPEKYIWEAERLKIERDLKIGLISGAKIVKDPDQEATDKQSREKILQSVASSKFELIRIMAQPFQMLSRREIQIRKLLSKFHDDPKLVKRKELQDSSKFDMHLAERVRAKAHMSRTKEETEWCTIDMVLNPQIWEAYGRKEEVRKYSNSQRNDAYKSSTTKPTDREAKADEHLDAISKLVGVNDFGKFSKRSSIANADEKTGGFSIDKEVNAARQKEIDDQSVVDTSKEWICPYSRSEALLVWQKSKSELKEYDAIKTSELLNRYNGTFEAYKTATEEIERNKKREDKALKVLLNACGDHLSENKEHSNAFTAGEKVNSAINYEKHGRIVESDVDLRCRQVLKEIDLCVANRNKKMDSSSLTVIDQRFPTSVLRVELESELDRLLREQVVERERGENFMIADDEEPADVDDSISIAANGSKLIKSGGKHKERHKAEQLKAEVLKSRKRVRMDNKKGDSYVIAKLMNELGVGGCVGCRVNPCQWKPCDNKEGIVDRLQVVGIEAERVRRLPRSAVVLESTVAMSTLRGGGTTFRRRDLLEELEAEEARLLLRNQLVNVDKELHDAYAARKEFIEVTALHGYSTLLWVSDAKKALEIARDKLIAKTTSLDMVDNVLDWMLEGWYFGERESSYPVGGFVPTLKKSDPIRFGKEQFENSLAAMHKSDGRLSETSNTSLTKVRETHGEKFARIEEDSQWRIKEKKVVEIGSERDATLKNVEQTIRYGMFCLVFMYFRTVYYLRREQNNCLDKSSESGKNDLIDQRLAESEERRKMESQMSEIDRRQKKLQKAMSKASVGEKRIKQRLEEERKEMMKKLMEEARQRERDRSAIVLIQRITRGHIGRKAARRWMMKKSEMEAMRQLLEASSLAIQRTYRGWKGRIRAVMTRREMASFIATMRMEEAEADEEEYWRTHSWNRLKRDFGKWMGDTLSASKLEGDEIVGASASDTNEGVDR